MLQTLKGQAGETALCNGMCSEFEVPAQLTKITILRGDVFDRRNSSPLIPHSLVCRFPFFFSFEVKLELKS